MNNTETLNICVVLDGGLVQDVTLSGVIKQSIRVEVRDYDLDGMDGLEYEHLPIDSTTKERYCPTVYDFPHKGKITASVQRRHKPNTRR